jgi:hypothetical protein
VKLRNRPARPVSIFTPAGKYRPVTDRRCLRCRHVLDGEDRYGPYYPAGAVPNDRMYMCGEQPRRQPHTLPTGVLTYRGGLRLIGGALAVNVLIGTLAAARVLTFDVQFACQSSVVVALAAVLVWSWTRTSNMGAGETVLIGVMLCLVAVAVAGEAHALTSLGVLILSEVLAATAVTAVTVRWLRGRRPRRTPQAEPPPENTEDL